MFWSITFSLFRTGPSATIKALFTGPARLLAIPSRGGSGLAGFCIGGGVALLLASFFGLNRQAGAVLTVSSLFLAAGYPGMMLARVLSDVWNRVVKPRTSQAFTRVQEIFSSGVIGLTPGFFLLAILSPRLRGLFALGLLGAGIYLLVSKQGGRPTGPAVALPPGGMSAFLAWLLSSAALATFLDLVFAATAQADDGGANEVQGGDGTDKLNWTNVVAWWNSQGAGQAIGQGVAPATSATVGAALIPPLAPPTGGLVIVDDVVKGADTEDGKHFRYEADVRCTSDSALIPADGRTSAEFLAIVRTNNPDWSERTMMGTASFAFTAPSGFSLQPAQEFSDGSSNNAKRAKVICVPPQDAAFAPGRIPGVVYLYASCPEGTVNGHAQVQIEVGGGELVIHPLARTWLRGPSEGQPADSIFLFARLQWPDYCTGYTDADAQALNATITLKGLGEKAAYIAGCESSEPAEAWRRFNLAPNPQLLPAHLEDSPSVELGMEGRIMAGLLQKTFSLQVLCPPRIKFEPEEPFLVPDALEQVEVKATVKGAAPGEEWQVESPLFSTGDQDIVLAGSCEPKAPAEAKLTFRLGVLPKERDEASATFKVKAKLTKPVKDYAGPTETDEVKLTVNVRRPGLIFLTKMPVNVPGDGKTTAKFSLTVLDYIPGEGGKPGTLKVDESMLKEKALKFAEKIEAEGAAARAFSAAALHLTYGDVVGEGLNRRAYYTVVGTAVIPGTGETHLGKLEISVPNPPPRARDEDYRKNLQLGLVTVAIPKKTDDYATEKRLMLQALDEMILRPYATLQASWANASKLEWEADWIRSWWGTSAQDSLEQLMKLHDLFKDELDKDTRHDAFNLHRRRRDFYEQVTKAWEQVATSSAGVDAVLAAGECTAKTARWLSEALFPKLVEIAMTTLARSPKWADFSGSAAGYFQKYINFFAEKCSEAYVNEKPNPWGQAGQDTVDEIWKNLFTDMFDLFYGSQAEKPFEGKYDFGLKGPEGTLHGLKVKSRLYAYFAIIKLFQHWIWEKKENGDDKGFLEACQEVANDIAVKTVADSFEWFCGPVPPPLCGKGAAQSDFKGAIGDSYGEIVEALRKLERLGQGRA